MNEPVILRPGTQQHLGHRQAHRLRIRQLLRMARTALARADHMVIDQHVQCRQKGVEPCSHKRPSMPFSHFMVNPTRRTGPGWHADSFKTPGTSAPSSRIKGEGDL